MAVQSLPTLPAFPEPRLLSARAPVETRESFALPEEPREDAPARPAERPARDAAEPEGRRDTQPEPGEQRQAAVPGDKFGKPEPAKRAEPVQQPSTQPGQTAGQAQAAGAAVSLLIAGEATPAVVAAGESRPAAEKTATEALSDKVGPDSAAAVAIALPIVIPAPPPAPQLSAGAAQQAEGEASVAGPGKVGAQAGAAIALSTTRGNPATALGQTGQDAASAPAPETLAGKPIQAGAAAQATGQAEAAETPAEAKPAPEFKLPEALQQIANPIELGATARPQPRSEVMPAASLTPEQAAQQPAQSQHPTTAPTPVSSVPLEIGLKALSGAKRFEIRLDPAELGRVDVDLQISDSGEVSAKLVVDRVETLHMLQRDARTLERAFEQAGLKPSDGAIDITLRDPGEQSRQQQRQDEAQQGRRFGAADAGTETPQQAQPAMQPVRRMMRLGGVDVSV